MFRAFGALLFVVWVLAAHDAGETGSACIAALALGALGALILLPALGAARTRLRAALLLLAWLLLLVLLVRSTATALLLSLPSVLLPLLLAWMFARTLRPGHEALITHFVRLSDGSEQAALPAVRHYTRRLTALWALLLLVLGLVAAVLAALCVPQGWLALLGVRSPWPLPARVWNAWVNGWAYAVPVAALVLELVLRRRLLPEAPPPHPLRFARALFGHWRELRAP
ncbi:MAG: hypothetical protein M0P72_05025 [Metallibacterium scheffleri]|jgi:uncharacterized membrane protein|uniref:hypothetical protein n=1 Tax=Metallibacterium scheffleri TaxID=993689 RepID=UPI0026EF93FF|nr:hypothetical protein [Metallibacterium scheffleri]MCK9366496.1 hypothetical protein [Metallibacterium scheffleri]